MLYPSGSFLIGANRKSNGLKTRSMIDKQRLVVIVGATAVGKTDLSIQLAKRIGGEVISADSRYFYRGMDIGTAKPTIAERQAVRHHLIDILEPDEAMSLAQFLERAQVAILDVHERGKLPILVGGTGQFISAIVHGWSPPRGEPDPALRAELSDIVEREGKTRLHQWLSRVDPHAAEKIDASNSRRTIRAVEVILSSGERFSTQRQLVEPMYDILMIGIARSRVELYARIDERIELMIQNGFEDEVRNLLAKGYSPALPAFSAIGYREMVSVVEGAISIDESITAMKRKTRNFVRRQANWFKPGDLNIQWFSWDEHILERVENAIRKEYHWREVQHG